MEAQKKKLIIMYHEIHRLRNLEHFSIQRIADHFSINFRIVKNMLDMTEEQFDEYAEKKGIKSRQLDPYRDFIVTYLQKYPDTPAAVLHDKLKEHFVSFPKVDPKTVYNYVMIVRNDFNIIKVAGSDRQYSTVPDLYDQDGVFLYRENNGDYIMTDIFERYQASRPFKVVFCRASDPESKGKVENTVKYIKQNFLFNRTFINLGLLNDQAMSWLSRTGNAMVHNTTRKIPQEQWAYEQPVSSEMASVVPCGQREWV